MHYTSSHIFGPISYFSLYFNQGAALIDLHENYQKRSPRNRYVIAGPDGRITLTIPLKKGKNQQQNMHDVHISYDEDWVSLHEKTIISNYKRAPYFEYYMPHISEVLHSGHELLHAMNTMALQKILHLLQADIDIKFSTDYIEDKSYDGIECAPYAQVFEYKHGFTSGLSILDLLFCVGAEAKCF